MSLPKVTRPISKNARFPSAGSHVTLGKAGVLAWNICTASFRGGLHGGLREHRVPLRPLSPVLWLEDDIPSVNIPVGGGGSAWATSLADA